jgi:hypothetical protein
MAGGSGSPHLYLLKFSTADFVGLFVVFVWRATFAYLRQSIMRIAQPVVVQLT